MLVAIYFAVISGSAPRTSTPMQFIACHFCARCYTGVLTFFMCMESEQSTAVLRYALRSFGSSVQPFCLQNSPTA